MEVPRERPPGSPPPRSARPPCWWSATWSAAQCPFWACMPSKTLLNSAARRACGADYDWARASARRDWMISREEDRLPGRRRSRPAHGGGRDAGDPRARRGSSAPGAVEVRGPTRALETLSSGERHRRRRLGAVRAADPRRRRGVVLDQPGGDVDARAPVEPRDPGRGRRRRGDGAGVRPVRGSRHARRGRRPDPVAGPSAHVEGCRRPARGGRPRPPHRASPRQRVQRRRRRADRRALGRLDRRGGRAAGGGRAASGGPPRAGRRGGRRDARRARGAPTPDDQLRIADGLFVAGDVGRRAPVHARRRLRRRGRRARRRAGRPDRADLRVGAEGDVHRSGGGCRRAHRRGGAGSRGSTRSRSRGTSRARQGADDRRRARAPDGGRGSRARSGWSGSSRHARAPAS